MASSLPTAHGLARLSLAGQHPLTRDWVDDGARLARLAAAHELDLRLATDLDLAAQRAGLLQVGQPPESFLNRWVPVPDNLEVMLSIRFEGMHPGKPFVDGSALSRPLAAGDLLALARAATDVYGGFRPGYLRVWSAEPTDAFVASDRDKRFLAAPVGDLAAAGEVPRGLTLARTRDLARYPDAVAAYAAVDAAHPGHPAQAAIQDADGLQESIEAGTLFDVLVDGEWAGYVGAMEDGAADLGLGGYVVQEIVLAPGHRGRGYGAHLTTLLARALPTGTGSCSARSMPTTGERWPRRRGPAGATSAAGCRCRSPRSDNRSERPVIARFTRCRSQYPVGPTCYCGTGCGLVPATA